MNIAIILFGGKGERLNSDMPKQYLNIGDKPLFYYPINTFNKHPLIDKIYLVTDKEHILYMKDKCKEFCFNKVVDVIIGGKTRAQSSKNALLSIDAKDEDIILIHDGDRIFVSEKIISDNINLLNDFDGVVTATRCDDSLIDIKDKNIKYLKRDGKYRLQTPQTFRYKIVLEAHKKNKNINVSDDAFLVAKLNYHLVIANGEKINFKITTNDDFLLAKAILEK